MKRRKFLHGATAARSLAALSPRASAQDAAKKGGNTERLKFLAGRLDQLYAS